MRANSSASQKAAGKDLTEKKASGTVVGDEIRTASKTAEEIASADFAGVLNTNKANMSQILKDVSTYLEDMTENNKENLSHLLFYTGDGSDLHTWSKGNSSPVFQTAHSTEEAAATEDTLCNWAKIDYEKKTGTAVAKTSLTKNDSGNAVIALFDQNGKLLDTYVIDPQTGKGVNAANAAVDLPQTGNNAPNNLLLMLLALVMSGLGAIGIKRSGIITRKD